MARHPNLICSAPGCERGCDYKEAALCQKHYFRRFRNGHLGLKSETHKPIERRDNGNGYQMILAPNHPLAMKNGYAYEHRLVVYRVYGEALPECEICHIPLTWKSCHVDHINENVLDNTFDNLRPICRGCNTERGHSTKSRGKIFITVNGETLTASGWSRKENVRVSASAISYRKKKGWSDYDAVFGKKITHIATTAQPAPKKVKIDPRKPL